MFEQHEGAGGFRFQMRPAAVIVEHRLIYMPDSEHGECIAIHVAEWTL